MEKLNNSNNEKLKKEVNKSNRTTNENTQSKNKIWMNFFLYQKEQWVYKIIKFIDYMKKNEKIKKIK